MRKSTPFVFRISSLVFALWFFLAVACVICAAQSVDKTANGDDERTEAFELYKQGKFVDAMPLFERLAADHPSDPAMKEAWAWCILQYSGTLPDPEERKKARIRARMIAVEAKNLGDTSQLLQVLLDLPEAGFEATFSDRKEVNEAMKAAEADFSRGDLDKAREGYLRALALDPTNYDAALFIGDVYFKQHVYGSAGEWFLRATQSDPNRETAYRYWGDALAATGKEDDARGEFINAIVAEPYNRLSWTGLTNWLQRNKLELNNIRLKDGAAVTVKDEKNINITLDTSLGKDDPNALAWMTYGLGRASWHGDKFKKEFPNESQYRRTLREEADSLNLMITVLKEQKDYPNNLKRLDPSLRALIKIQEAGFIEPFVLLNRADPEIAKDYESYRALHRENIRGYLDTFVVPQIGSATVK